MWSRVETISAIRLLRRYRRAQRRWPRLWPPVTFNDHIVHRSLFDHDPRFTVLSDKIAVKQFIAERVGDAYVVPLLGAWDSVEAIEWDQLPQQFVIKPSASSGPYAVVDRSGEFDLDALKYEMR